MLDLILAVAAAAIVFKVWKWLESLWKEPSRNEAVSVTIHRSEDEDHDVPDIDYQAGQELSEVVSVQTQLLIHYKDASGNRTKRLIDVREADIGWEYGCLFGHCHLRRAFRTFRIDRIERCIIPETGEIIQIQQHLRKVYTQSPASSMDTVLREAIDVLRALLYIGKADGRLTRKEKEIMLEFCQSFSKDSRITMEDLDRAFDYYTIPSKSTFQMICGRIAKLSLEARTQVVEKAAKMISTEKKADLAEIEGINYLGKKLAIPVPEFTPK